MSGVGSVVAEACALVATVLAVAAAIPQLHRVIRGGDGRGVSITTAALGVGTEVTWVAYASARGLWSALPEAVAMTAANVLLLIALRRRGAVTRQAAQAGGLWAVALAAAGAFGGVNVIAVVLGGAYLVQVVPAVWTVWTTAMPSGVAVSTWTMIGLEGVLWGVYGLHHADPAVLCFAVIATVAAAAILARKATVTRRTPSHTIAEDDVPMAIARAAR